MKTNSPIDLFYKSTAIGKFVFLNAEVSPSSPENRKEVSTDKKAPLPVINKYEYQDLKDPKSQKEIAHTKYLRLKAQEQTAIQYNDQIDLSLSIEIRKVENYFSDERNLTQPERQEIATLTNALLSRSPEYRRIYNLLAISKTSEPIIVIEEQICKIEQTARDAFIKLKMAKKNEATVIVRNKKIEQLNRDAIAKKSTMATLVNQIRTDYEAAQTAYEAAQKAYDKQELIVKELASRQVKQDELAASNEFNMAKMLLVRLQNKRHQVIIELQQSKDRLEELQQRVAVFNIKSDRNLTSAIESVKAEMNKVDGGKYKSEIDKQLSALVSRDSEYMELWNAYSAQSRKPVSRVDQLIERRGVESGRQDAIKRLTIALNAIALEKRQVAKTQIQTKIINGLTYAAKNDKASFAKNIGYTEGKQVYEEKENQFKRIDIDVANMSKNVRGLRDKVAAFSGANGLIKEAIKVATLRPSLLNNTRPNKGVTPDKKTK